MPSEYHALRTPHSCLIQDPSTSRTSRYGMRCDAMASSNLIPVEKNVPYETQAYAIMVLEGAHGDGSRSAMRKAGWETLPRGAAPISVDGWYPPNGIPAPTTVNIQGDRRPEIIVSLDGHSAQVVSLGDTVAVSGIRTELRFRYTDES